VKTNPNKTTVGIVAGTVMNGPNAGASRGCHLPRNSNGLNRPIESSATSKDSDVERRAGR
jgi:hypothetical protein